jgi:aspartyl-tRNA(Asn)/glutamyl-tRNA(Gln) amidotransferase subunit A
MKGHHRGPQHGIPFGLKDVYATAGVPTTGNSAAFRDHLPSEDATVVRLLYDAGAILLGKHATHELTYGGVSFELPWPPPRNPFDLSRDTGGSSSGSGAAVAAGLSMFALGTDTGGSVRNPAAHCGLVGLKPTYGLISRSGVMMNSYSRPLRFIDPQRRRLRRRAGLHRRSRSERSGQYSYVRQPLLCFHARPRDRRMRIGLMAHLFEIDLPASPEVRQAMAQAMRQLEALGAQVEEVKIAPLQEYAV